MCFWLGFEVVLVWSWISLVKRAKNATFLFKPDALCLGEGQESSFRLLSLCLGEDKLRLDEGKLRLGEGPSR